MTITKLVTSDLFETGPANQRRLIRMGQRFSSCSNSRCRQTSTIGWWTTEEHNKFLEAMELYPSGPWKRIAQHIGSRNSRQVMTHAQKYRQRIKRRETRKTQGKRELSKQVDIALMQGSLEAVRPSTASTNANFAFDGDTTPELAAKDQPLELLLELEVVALEPLPLFQNCETSEPVAEEAPIANLLLLDELQHLLVPVCDGGANYADIEHFDCDELIEVLLDPAINWDAVCM
ncbi:Myb domain-contaning protein [Phytophthora cinnamomi]|uniref:Myb domain-contaning protein n=1 Tax=Phytophthora cinnamomi TaxID=4785 RepID=UPI00355AA29F|nr:Myb domain-contaning protein [Phytophthora cinnamomi]